MRRSALDWADGVRALNVWEYLRSFPVVVSGLRPFPLGRDGCVPILPAAAAYPARSKTECFRKTLNCISLLCCGVFGVVSRRLKTVPVYGSGPPYQQPIRCRGIVSGRYGGSPFQRYFSSRSRAMPRDPFTNTIFLDAGGQRRR